MTWRLLVEQQADAEILEAAAWYGAHHAATGSRFLSGVQQALDAIKDNPLQYQIIQGRVRRVLVRRFPYALLYSVVDRDVIVTVCTHTSRDPKRWQRRFQR